MEIIIIVIISLLALTTGLGLWLVLRHIKQIARQLDFLNQHDSRMQITSDVNLPPLNELVDNLNRLLRNNRNLQQRLKQEQINTMDTITGLSHDIRTPLASLDGYIQLLQESDDEKKFSHSLDIMSRRVNSLTQILDELFTYAKLQHEEYQLTLQELDFNQLLQQTLFAFYDDFAQNNIEPLLELPETPVMIKAQPEAVIRILQNIIKNVLDHGAGDVHLSLMTNANTHSPAGKPTVTLNCSNSLPEDAAPNPDEIFLQFYKGNPSRQKSSTGLGLSIARGLAEKMGATLEVEVKNKSFIVLLTFDLIIKSN
ncbi:MAG TPA: HAMP domain-containing histidine kinase [Clostridiaceae bacterium]|nr:HAMP domain-containing histidine kinase [Clostridiaceae bacterium]